MSYVSGWLYMGEESNDGYERASLMKHEASFGRFGQFLRETDQRNLSNHVKAGWEFVKDLGWCYLLQRRKLEEVNSYEQR